MKILIFFAPFGGGHLASAKIIKQTLEELKNPELEVKIVDGSGKNTWFKNILVKSYSVLATRWNLIWSVFYCLSKSSFIIGLLNIITGWTLIPQLQDIIETEKPDTIVTTYFIGQHLEEAVGNLNFSTSITTVITDPFTFHPVWIQDTSGQIIVQSQQALEQAKNYGYQGKICSFSPIIKQDFTKGLELQKIQGLKYQLGLKKPKVILIIGGAEGLKNGAKILNTLLQQNIQANFIIVCGRDQIAKRNCENIKSVNPFNAITVLGFSHKIYELMNLSDLIITKAGPGIVFEAAFLKKPIIISSYLWEQELGNKNFVLNNQIGYYEPNITRLGALAAHLLTNQSELESIQTAYQVLNLQNNNRQIAEFIVSQE